jgi:peptidoglycan/xylan/chitin deacetylase (PgdA/CDA1 family)
MSVRDKAETLVSVTFDDGWSCQFEAASMLAARGMKGTFYVNSNRIGLEGFLSWAQLEALAADGHEIGGHGLDHLDITQLSSESALRQIEEDRNELMTRGFAAQSFAYPFGSYDSNSESIVRDSGYSSGRGAWGLRNITAEKDDRPYAESVPPPDPFALKTPCCISSSTPLSALDSYVEQAEKRGGGWLPFVLHRLCDGCGDSPAASIGTGTFGGFLTWLEQRSVTGTVVRPVADVMAQRSARD